MTIKGFLLNLALLVATFLVVGFLSFLLGLKIVFPVPPETRQEGMWLMVRQHGTDADDLRVGLDAIVDRDHGFARYEAAAIGAQLAVIDDTRSEAEAFRKFCQTLAWKTCKEKDVREALKMLFAEGDQ